MLNEQRIVICWKMRYFGVISLGYRPLKQICSYFELGWNATFITWLTEPFDFQCNEIDKTLRCVLTFDILSFPIRRCDRSCGAGDISCYNKKIMRYSLWTFRLRSNELPQRIFNYRIVAYRYKTAPEIRYYFKRGNTENFFEIITQRKSDGIYASIRNKRKIKGPKIMSLEFYGDVIHSETGDLASRFVNRIYVFVSRNEFWVVSSSCVSKA